MIMTTEVNQSEVLQTFELIGILYVIEMSKDGQCNIKQKKFNTLERKHWLEILQVNNMITLENVGGILYYRITEGGKIFLNRFAKIPFPKITTTVVWE